MRGNRIAVVTLSIAAALIGFSSSVLQAEEANDRGRLPDGRAFRTDSEGTQVVDYIAELEVTIEQLNRRVLGLEDEVKEKRDAIARLETGRVAEAALREKNLVAETEVKQGAQKAVEQCSSQVQSLNAELEQVRSDADIERQLHEKRSGACQASIQELHATIDDLKRILETREASLKSVEEKEAQSRQQASEQQSKAAALLASDSAVPSALPQEQRASLSMARLRAVDSIRGKLLTDLNQIKGLIAVRDRTYRAYSQKRRVVAFKPSALVAKSGRDLSAIQSGIQSATAVSDLSVYRRDIADLEAKVQDDLALMKRLGE